MADDRHALLLIPPQVDPSQPLYAVAALAAYARECGARVAVDDLNVRAYETFASPAWVAHCLDRMRATERRVSRKWPGRTAEFRRLRRQAETAAPFVLDLAEDAKRTLRDPRRFYDFDEYTRAMRAVDRALDIVSCAHFPTRVTYQSFEMDASVAFLDEIQTAVADPEQNPFIEFFEREVVPGIRSAAPPLVGFSLMSPTQFIPALTLARLLKSALPGVVILVGGMPIIDSADMLEGFGVLSHLVDGFCVGDGEETLIGAIEAVQGGRDLTGVPNLVTFRDNRPVFGPLRNFPMDRLPTPDFDGFPLERYFSPELNLPLITSKGCYWGECTFCSDSVFDRAYRSRPMRLVVEDVVRLQQRYGTEVFSLIDDSISAQQITRFVDDVLARNLRLRWRFRTRAEPGYTPELCRRLVAAGGRKVYIGIESASQRVLDLMKKGTDLETVETVLGNLEAAGLPVHAFCMVGFPTETPEDVRATADLIFRHRDVVESMLFSGFVLRRRSAAYLRPEENHIRKIEVVGDGLVDAVRFEVASGIQPEDSEVIAIEVCRELAARVSQADANDRRYDERYAKFQYLGNRYFSPLDAPNFMYHCRYGRGRLQPTAGLGRERRLQALQTLDFAEARLAVPETVRIREVDGGADLLNWHSGHCVALSWGALDLVRRCDGMRPVAQVIALAGDGRGQDPGYHAECERLLRRLVVDGDLVVRHDEVPPDRGSAG